MTQPSRPPSPGRRARRGRNASAYGSSLTQALHSSGVEQHFAFTLGSLSPGATYHYRVQTKTTVGVGVLGADQTFTVGRVGGAPTFAAVTASPGSAAGAVVIHGL